MKSSSVLLINASGRAPVGEAADHPFDCAMCGGKFSPGDACAAFEPGKTFNDWSSLSCPESPWVCGWCQAAWNKDFMQRYSKSVVCQDGVFPCASNDHIAWWLLNPPQPPFVMFLSDQQQQHLVWRTPMALSAELFPIRYGEKLLWLRPAKLKKASAACGAIMNAFNEGRKGAPVKSPFVRIARELDTYVHGLVRSDVRTFVDQHEGLQASMDVLDELTPGEVWGLTAVLYAKNPHKPEPNLTPISR